MPTQESHSLSIYVSPQQFRSPPWAWGDDDEKFLWIWFVSSSSVLSLNLLAATFWELAWERMCSITNFFVFFYSVAFWEMMDGVRNLYLFQILFWCALRSISNSRNNKIPPTLYQSFSKIVPQSYLILGIRLIQIRIFFHMFLLKLCFSIVILKLQINL